MHIRATVRSSEGLGRTWRAAALLERGALNVTLTSAAFKDVVAHGRILCARVTTTPVSRRLINTSTRASPWNKGRRFCLLRSVLPLSVNSTSAPSNEKVHGRKSSARRQAGVHVYTFATWMSVAMVTPRISLYSTL